MPIRLPSLRGVIKWPRTATAVIATSGLVIALVAVSRRIWRGGGKKAKDPDGTSSSKKFREKIDKEKKRSDSKEKPTTSKSKELVEEKEEETLKQTVLAKDAKVNVTIENKPNVLTEKPNPIAKVAETTKEDVTTKIRSSVLTENAQSHLLSAEETKTEATVHYVPNVIEAKSQEQAIVSDEIKTKVPTQNKPDILTKSLESQPRAAQETKIVVKTTGKPTILEEEFQVQRKVAEAVDSKVTTQINPGEKEKPQPSKLQEPEIKVKPLNKEAVIRKEHLLSGGTGDHNPKNDKNAKSVNLINQELTPLERTALYSVSETNQESTPLVKTNIAVSQTNRVQHRIFFVEENWVNFFPEVVTSTIENLDQGGTSQSVGKRDASSDLNDATAETKEVVELCEQTKLIPRSKEIVLKLTSDPTQSSDIAIISDFKTLGKPLKTESKPSNELAGAGKEQSVELVVDSQLEKVKEVQLKSTDKCGADEKQLNSISPTLEETVKRVNSVISDSSKPREIQAKSLNSLDNANKELNNCSSSHETVDKQVKVVKSVDIGLGKPLEVQLCESKYIDNTDNEFKDSCGLSLKTEQTGEIVNSVISGVGKLQINELEPSINIEGDDKLLRDAPVAEKSAEGVISLESQSGELQHIPSSYSPSRTEQSVVIISEEEKDVKLKQVTVTGVFPEDCVEATCEEGVLPKGKEVSDIIKARKEGKAEQGEGEKSLCQGSTASEVALVSVVDTAEPPTVEEKITKLCIVESGSSALGDQAEVVPVQPSCTASAGLTEEVEVCQVVKDFSKTLESNSKKSDSTLPVKGEEGELIDKEAASSILEKGDMLTKGAEAKSDLVKGKSVSGKRKGKKGKKMLDEVEKMVEKMEVKDIMRESEESILQNGDVGEDHSGKSTQVHASGISSPSIPNFPDNRSEGSSCGDSGKGRSDVTTPGGLEEDLREVSFSNRFSPPCSTSGPEEEEEEDRLRRDSGSTAEDGSQAEIGSTIGGEEIVGDAAVVVGSDGMVIPVPVPIYHGMVPVTPPPSVYEFVIPQGLVGRLIGKHGSFVNLIKARTSATIFIKTHPETNKLKVCAIEGTDEEIQSALDMIREKFPLRKYSSMTLEQVFFLPLPPPTFTLIPDSLPLQLVEGVSNDVILSALVSPSHYFLQQPTHPTYPTLAKLDMWMAMCYQDANAPMLPEDVKAGIICAAPTMGGWYRAEIVAVEELPSTPEDESVEEGELVKWCDVRFVDYGGYERLPSHSLRQIRSDFMTLPFQASECYLASVIPAPTSDENKMADGWSMEAYALVEELTQAQVLKAQVVGHATDGLPLVLLYAFSHSYGQVVQVNNELVNRGLAVWAVPVVETDEVLLAGGSGNISGDENPPEDQPKAAVA